MKRNYIIHYNFLIFLFLTLFGFLFSIYPAQACTTPTYQYALERWPADPYEVFVFHQGTLSQENQTKVDQLKKASRDEKFGANVMVKTVDLSEPPGESIQKLWEAQSNAELPWMVVKYPRYSRIPGDAWSGKLNNADLKALLESPARRKIASRILEGETAVWVFLESGDKEQDKAKFSLLEKQLKRMSETLKVEIPDTYTEQTEETSQDVKFTGLKLSRNDPDESLFIQMLLNTEPDLKTIPKPMAFPIFARGRLLYAFVGDGISDDNIQAVCEFLVNWCSCEVKELNPGVDLLMSVSWDNALYTDMHDEILLAMKELKAEEAPKPKETVKIEAPPVETKPEISEKKIEPVEVTPEPAIKVSDSPGDLSLSELNKGTESVTAVSEPITKTSDNVSSSNLTRNILLMMLGLVLGIAIFTFAVLWRKRQRA